VVVLSVTIYCLIQPSRSSPVSQNTFEEISPENNTNSCPDRCPRNWSPVCGEDEKTYGREGKCWFKSLPGWVKPLPVGSKLLPAGSKPLPGVQIKTPSRRGGSKPLTGGSKPIHGATKPQLPGGGVFGVVVKIVNFSLN